MADFEQLTEKLLQGLGSEKLLFKNQQKKIERMAEANKLLKKDLENEELLLEKAQLGTQR